MRCTITAVRNHRLGGNSVKKEIQIRHAKEEVEGLAMNEKVRYRVWIEHDDCIAGSSGDLVNAGKEKLDL